MVNDVDSQKSLEKKSSNNHPYHGATLSSNTTASATTYETEKIPLYNPAASTSTLASTDPRTQDIKQFAAGFERMQDERLEKQRYVMSGKKGDEISITALGAKVERALGRRMTGQDATFTPRRQELPAELPEKRSLEVEATS